MSNRNHMKDILRNNVPSAMRNNQLIEEYIDVIGEIFEDIREDINYKVYETDYAKTRDSDLNRLAANFGLNLNTKLNPNVIRSIIRDAPAIFSQMGTRKSLDWALKIIGFRNYEIDEAWIPNPDLIRKGYFRQLNDPNDARRYEIGRRSYTDFVVGREYVTENGTYFEGYVYTDFDKANPISDIPIYGETYKNYNELDMKNMVSKTPYLLVRLYEPPNFDFVISDRDPETGDTLYISAEEKQRIVNDTIRYLIQELQRTATTKIILVTDLFTFDTTVPTLSDTFSISSTESVHRIETYINTFLDDYIQQARVTAQGSIDYNKVGSNRPVGGTAPYVATGEYTSGLKVGPLETADRMINGTRQLDTISVAIKPPEGYTHHVFIDIGATVSFTAPSDSSVIVEGKRNYHLSPSKSSITTVNAGQSFEDYFEEFHTIMLTFVSGSNQQTNITVNYG